MIHKKTWNKKSRNTVPLRWKKNDHFHMCRSCQCRLLMTTSAPWHPPTMSSTTASASWAGLSSSAPRIRHFGDILDRTPSCHLCKPNILEILGPLVVSYAYAEFLVILGPVVVSCASQHFGDLGPQIVSCAYTAYWIPGPYKLAVCSRYFLGDSRTRSCHLCIRSVLWFQDPLSSAVHMQHVDNSRTILVSWCVQVPKWPAVRDPGHHRKIQEFGKWRRNHVPHAEYQFGDYRAHRYQRVWSYSWTFSSHLRSSILRRIHDL